MKRLIPVVCALLILLSICASGCANQKPINADSLKGYWGRDGEVICHFEDDNVCNIGGVYGTYSVADDKTLNMETKGGSTTYTFTWVDKAEDVSTNTWNLTDDILIIGNMQYSWIDPKDVEIETQEATTSATASQSTNSTQTTTTVQ